MQSIKNTTVSIVLLFLSYGVYQVITKPLPSEMQNEPFETLEISEASPSMASDSSMKDLVLPSQDDMFDDIEESIPSHLLKLDTSDSFANSSSGQADQRSFEKANQSTLDDFSKSSKSSNSDFQSKSMSPPTQPKFPVQLASTEQDFAKNESHEFKNSFQNQAAQEQSNVQNAAHLNSDSNIIPSTVMSEVASRPESNSEFDDSAFGQESNETEPANANRPKTLSETWPAINSMVEQSNFPSALAELSRFYRDEALASNERQQLLDWLDALAAKVIYSSEHHLRSLPYIIQPGDTIGSLARQWQVPAQLIYNVNTNKIPDPNNLKPGVEIKLIQGPFNAEIDSQQRVMTLFLDDMYAGRFNIQPGLAMSQGEFNIVDKSAQDHIDRPYWMALNNGASIYASKSAPNQEDEVGMNLREAEEVFSILSASSRIRVLR